MTQITPGAMAALAARASTALAFIADEKNVPTAAIAGLKYGEQFCQQLSEEASLAKQAPSCLSPRTVAAGELMELVTSLPGGSGLLRRSSAIADKLSLMRKTRKPTRDVDAIRRYFLDFAEQLAAIEQAQRRVIAMRRHSLSGNLC